LGGVIIPILSGKRFVHQIEMISVIKNGKLHWAAAGCAGIVISRTCISLTWFGKDGSFALIFLILFLNSSVGYRRLLLSLCYSFFSVIFFWISYYLSCC
jgi:hypothetical protein